MTREACNKERETNVCRVWLIEGQEERLWRNPDKTNDKDKTKTRLDVIVVMSYKGAMV